MIKDLAPARFSQQKKKKKVAELKGDMKHNSTEHRGGVQIRAYHYLFSTALKSEPWEK